MLAFLDVPITIWRAAKHVHTTSLGAMPFTTPRSLREFRRRRISKRSSPLHDGKIPRSTKPDKHICDSSDQAHKSTPSPSDLRPPDPADVPSQVAPAPLRCNLHLQKSIRSERSTHGLLHVPKAALSDWQWFLPLSGAQRKLGRKWPRSFSFSAMANLAVGSRSGSSLG